MVKIEVEVDTLEDVLALGVDGLGDHPAVHHPHRAGEVFERHVVEEDGMLPKASSRHSGEPLEPSP
jgi:hypothetical protein